MDVHLLHRDLASFSIRAWGSVYLVQRNISLSSLVLFPQQEGKTLASLFLPFVVFFKANDP